MEGKMIKANIFTEEPKIAAELPGTLVVGVPGPAGPRGETGPAGPQGPAYTLTSADKATIVNAVKADMPTLTVTGIDADGESHSWTMYGVAQ